jgi:hypothetical protein
LGLVIPQRDSGRSADTRKKRSPIDFHCCPPVRTTAKAYAGRGIDSTENRTRPAVHRFVRGPLHPATIGRQ